MRYWVSFLLLLGAVLIVAISLFWAVLGLPLLFVVLVAGAGYGLLVVLNLAPPGRPGEAGPSDAALPADPTRGRANPLSDPNFAHHYPYDPEHYDAFEDAHAYWEDPYADDARIAATPIVLASIGLLAVAFLGIAAAAIQWGIGGGGGQPHAPVGAVLGEEAPTVTTPVASATATATATPTSQAPAAAATTQAVPTASAATAAATAAVATNTPRTQPTSAPTTRPATPTPVPPTPTKPRPTTQPTSAATPTADQSSGTTAQSTSSVTSSPHGGSQGQTTGRGSRRN
jgi:hypothetical protein